jgi:hypothetical protein
MTSTFAEVLESAEKSGHEVIAYADSATPAGHFQALIDIDGDKEIYLLEGEKNDPYARVKGYVLMVFYEAGVIEEIRAFAQDSTTGKVTDLGALSSYHGNTESVATAFAQMV